MLHIETSVLQHLLSITDLTIKTENSHCIQLIVEAIQQKLSAIYSNIEKLESSRVVSVQNNYWDLGYNENEITLSSRYTKYISSTHMLRTQMTSAVPSLLNSIAAKQKQAEALYLIPGLVYRRDVLDKHHVAEPHQMDVWYITRTQQTREHLLALVKTILNALLPNVQWRYHETTHHYTDDGIEVEIYHQGKWVELLECGLAGKNLLNNHGLEEMSGLALGMGLDRAAMLVKNIPDIRMLRSSNPILQQQMTHLKPYKQVAKTPTNNRDLSLSIDKNKTIEEVTEKIIQLSETLGMAESLASVNLIGEYEYETLPVKVHENLGMHKNHKNMVIRLVLQHLSQTLTDVECNTLATLIYKNLHEGDRGYL